MAKYTSAQKKAYYSGMGYACAANGKAINFKNEKNKQSFYAGWGAGKKKIASDAERYPDNPRWKKSAPSAKPNSTRKRSSSKKTAPEKQEPVNPTVEVIVKQ